MVSAAKAIVGWEAKIGSIVETANSSGQAGAYLSLSQ
jgi:hypothetical protein